MYAQNIDLTEAQVRDRAYKVYPNCLQTTYLTSNHYFSFSHTVASMFSGISPSLISLLNVCVFYFNFADSPVFRERPGNVEADVGSNVTLRCDVDSNPEPEITWTYEGSRRVLSTGPAYTFWMSHDMAGRYTCTARVPGFQEISADAHVLLKGNNSSSSGCHSNFMVFKVFVRHFVSFQFSRSTNSY